ncbi:hypothetical protein [Dyadobacter sp. BHUBP1]|uniref:hypothetical protein n=1 Tax=Dyadobacter sp. BHUBP1 TaxID=3424178 RepID=UPI003D3578D7
MVSKNIEKFAVLKLVAWFSIILTVLAFIATLAETCSYYAFKDVQEALIELGPSLTVKPAPIAADRPLPDSVKPI